MDAFGCDDVWNVPAMDSTYCSDGTYNINHDQNQNQSQNQNEGLDVSESSAEREAKSCFSCFNPSAGFGSCGSIHLRTSKYSLGRMN